MRLLVVEDDRRLAWLVQYGLRPYYVVETTESGRDGLFRITRFGYDAVVLDLSLPDMSGLQVCNELRRAGYIMPILILTGETDRSWVARLLDAGADDYLTKPFQLEELLARLRALIRRSQSRMCSNVLIAGDLELDVVSHIVRRQGKLINLRRKEFELLEYFMHNQAQALTRTMILEHIWSDGDELWGNVVDVHVKHLRDRIDRPFTEPLIQTVRGIGYKLEAPTQQAAERVVA